MVIFFKVLTSQNKKKSFMYIYICACKIITLPGPSRRAVTRSCDCCIFALTVLFAKAATSLEI